VRAPARSVLRAQVQSTRCNGPARATVSTGAAVEGDWSPSTARTLQPELLPPERQQRSSCRHSCSPALLLAEAPAQPDCVTCRAQRTTHPAGAAAPSKDIARSASGPQAHTVHTTMLNWSRDVECHVHSVAAPRNTDFLSSKLRAPGAPRSTTPPHVMAVTTCPLCVLANSADL
jgi:hypothetical protein